MQGVTQNLKNNQRSKKMSYKISEIRDMIDNITDEVIGVENRIRDITEMGDEETENEIPIKELEEMQEGVRELVIAVMNMMDEIGAMAIMTRRRATRKLKG